MSVATSVGSERNLLGESPEHAHQLVIEQPILLDKQLEALRQVDSSIFKAHTIDITWPVAEGPAGLDAALERICREADEALASGVNILILCDRMVGVDRVAIPGAAGSRVGAPPPRARGHAPAGRPRDRVGRAARRAPVRNADRLRRRRDQPVRDARDADGARRRRLAPRPHRRGGAEARDQGDRQGPPEDDLEDGHLDDPVLLRRPDLRGDRARAGARRPPLHRHPVADRRHRLGDPRPRGARPPCPRLPPERRSAPARRRLRLAERGRVPPVEPRDDLAAAARGAPRRLRELRAVLEARQRGGRPQGDAARAARVPQGGRAAAARSGRAGGGDREALLDRRHVARLAVARGARDARDRDEPDRRQVEHRRGRRGSRPLRARRQRRLAPLRDQAGRVGPLRREHPLPGERRPAADQDGAGREARRGRPAARPQGRRVHREDPLHDAGRRPDLAAAAPRHLLDRGPQAADLRPPLREPARAGVGEARVRDGRRHGRRRRREVQRRPRPDLRPRRRHRRLAAQLGALRRRSRGRSASPRRSRRS